MNKTYPKVVEQIHGEFNNAAQILLDEANRILSITPLKEKGLRLKNIGFINTVEAKEAERINGIKFQASGMADLINYYQITYPNYKFITDEMVNAICKKYRLVNAPVEKFKGFVPENKLSMIEKFKLIDKDKAVDHFIIKEAWHGITSSFLFRSIGARECHKKLNLKTIPLNHPFASLSSGSVFGINFPGFDITYIEKILLIDKTSMTICAPAKDFDLKGLSRFGFNFLASKLVVCPDPVVLNPVKGGHLILAAWGDESSDELVVNQKLN